MKPRPNQPQAPSEALPELTAVEYLAVHEALGEGTAEGDQSVEGSSDGYV